MADKIMTLHPAADKAGVNIDRAKYEMVREAIVRVIEAQGEITFTELTDAVGQQLDGKFDGSVTWYVTTVKLDLEARGLIERIPKSSPQTLRLAD